MGNLQRVKGVFRETNREQYSRLLSPSSGLKGQGGGPGSTSWQRLWPLALGNNLRTSLSSCLCSAGDSHGVRSARSQGAVNTGQTGGPPRVETGFGGPSMRHPASHVTECGLSLLKPRGRVRRACGANKNRESLSSLHQGDAGTSVSRCRD